VCVLRDLSFECDISNAAFRVCTDTTTKLMLALYDDMGHVIYTYHHKALGHKPSLDHVFISQDLKCYVNNYEVLNFPLNLPDHSAVSVCHCPFHIQVVRWMLNKKHTVGDYRWGQRL